MIIYVKKWISKKNEKEYVALMCNNGRAEKVLTFDRCIIADYLGFRIKDLATLEYGRTLIFDVAEFRKEI